VAPLIEKGCFRVETAFIVVASEMNHYVYILKSIKTGQFYIGSTQDLDNRLKSHNQGYNRSTKGGVPWEVVYVEEHASRSEAFQREQELKQVKKRRSIERMIHRFKNPGVRGSGK
jgi:putative endonuclease